MERGQLGTAAQRRIILVWEGTLAHLPESYTIQMLERYKRRLHLWDQAVSYWQIHDISVKWAWTLHSRSDLRVDLIVTTRPPDFAQAVARMIERENWPIRYVFAMSPQELGRRLDGMADVERVYFGLEEHRWAFGPHGVYFNPEPI